VDNATPEEWRPIPGYEDTYEASDLGRIRRTRGRNGHGYYPKVTILKLRVGKQGYSGATASPRPRWFTGWSPAPSSARALTGWRSATLTTTS
jgi:hypothetical protein